ncbi:hypothetical protein K1719_000331 [Acacia pycnantha]|nr:hypothetical protein K1719_000331 [Acacia pycnantha]
MSESQNHRPELALPSLMSESQNHRPELALPSLMSESQNHRPEALWFPSQLSLVSRSQTLSNSLISLSSQDLRLSPSSFSENSLMRQMRCSPRKPRRRIVKQSYLYGLPVA